MSKDHSGFNMYFQIGRQGRDTESDIDQTVNQSSESSSYYTAASSSSSEASSRRSSGVLVDSLENVYTGITNMKYTSYQCHLNKETLLW